MNGNHAVPQLYQNKNKIITRINGPGMKSTCCEDEGGTKFQNIGTSMN